MSPAWSPLPSPGEPGCLLRVRPGRGARAQFACLSAFPCLVAPAFWHRGRLPHADGDGERGRGSWRGAGRGCVQAGEQGRSQSSGRTAELLAVPLCLGTASP